MKKRAPRNRTITLSDGERRRLSKKIIDLNSPNTHTIPLDSTILGDFRQGVSMLPEAYIDLLILDPPYNLNKTFNGNRFKRRSDGEYISYLGEILALLKPHLKRSATIYICGDWQSSPLIYLAASEYFIIRNRITWEREKGRGASKNWKNSFEDIWFCTMSDEYTFNMKDVRLRRKVLAPYRSPDGAPKDWHESDTGKVRNTAPSNIWTDITVPFWSMPENTDHPAQKSEKLIARLILASSNPGDIVLDPFLGSGTTSVAAKKLGRRYLGMEIDREYCLLAEKRLELAEKEPSIQGYTDGVFWERNTHIQQTIRRRQER